MIHILNQMNLVHIHITCSFVVHSNIILEHLFTGFNNNNNNDFLARSCNLIGTHDPAGFQSMSGYMNLVMLQVSEGRCNPLSSSFVLSAVTDHMCLIL